ncbi:beta-lactamase regulating signal transducer with metallopeptidase domain [Sphingomonas leidyi]|uniref:Beta-lactamase regulating signal transducer with metallopeptidase domain n=1 Tax=Sphingomonas leidyi TaxID=68569 RepID=A0A7X5ZUT7_9SPHN|nr:M56 family metallopeptidase [Sphingomonas leidyi]NIJ63733.1 beta-lactamase regulating signal transducer with metallopeptidase domain [Sphingomonas leidyi]
MTALLGLVLKSLVIAGITLILLRLTRSRSAAERSLIAHLGLAGLVILPLATLVLPSMRLPMPEFVQSGFEAPAAQVTRPLAAKPSIADGAPAALPSSPTSAAGAPAAAQPWLTLPQGWERYAYALPVLALLLLTIVALLRLVRLRADAEVLVDPVWLSALAHAQRRMGMKSGTALLVSDALPSPISWGLARPTILLSADALAATDEAEAIIAHELAHVSALDWAKLMLARVATAIHWFNPLAWRLAREAHQLREEAADDAVLAANIDAPDYAQLLVRVARHESKGLLLGAHGVAPGKGSLKRRVGRVLDATLPRGRAQGSWIAGFGAGMLVMAAPLAALTVGAAESHDAAKPVRESNAGTRLAASPVAAPATSPAAHAAPTPAPAATERAPALAAATPTPVAALAQADPRQDRDARNDDGRDRELHAIIGARAVGVTPEYIEAIRRAAPQLGPISLDDATSMRAVGVTPEYVQAMMSTGLRIRSFDDIVSARAVGVNPDYVRSLVSAGFRGQLDDYVALAGMGVSADDVRRLRSAGMPVEIDTLALTRNGRKRGPNPNPRPNPNPHPDPDPNPDN